MWAAVAAVIETDPGVLERSNADSDQARSEREACAEKLTNDALTALTGGDYDRAMQLIDEAELIDPAYHPGRTDQRPYGFAWDQVRQAFTRTHAKAEAGEGRAPTTEPRQQNRCPPPHQKPPQQ